MTPVALTDTEYRLFSEWLAEQYGLWFGPERREILRIRLEPRRAALGLQSFEKLLFHLKFHPERETERARLIPHLTNNESYFLRERGQVDFFCTEIYPALCERLRRAGRRELRILSAGCAGGQEPYSILMRLQDAPGGAAVRVRMTGVDLDPDVLARARAGRFGSHSFRGVDPAVRDRFFRQIEPGEWEILPALRQAVDFRAANLADPEWARGLRRQDVIFCRNVLIYFNSDTLRRAAQGLHDALQPGGYLFLGHAETLGRVPTPLLPERRPGVVFYRRAEEQSDE